MGEPIERNLDNSYRKQSVPELKWAYDQFKGNDRLADAEKAEYISTRPLDEYVGKEKVAVIKWLRKEMPLVKYLLAAGSFTDLLCDETELHAKIELSTALSEAIERVAKCKVDWSKSNPNECPKSYRMECSYTNSKGKTKELRPYIMYENCK